MYHYNTVNMKLSKELAMQARKLNICQEWHDELKTLDDKRAMVLMYLKGIDFCLANDYPNNEYIRNNFAEIINEYGIFLDDRFSIDNPDKCVLLGNTNGMVDVDGYHVSELFAKHDSTLTINARDKAFVMIDVFDSAGVRVSATGDSKVCVNMYGDAHVWHESHDSAVIKIIKKQQKTY